MQRCLEIAQKGAGNVSPNPMVGSIIVYKDKIIGEGYHEKYGDSHAEINAINSVEKKSLLQYSTLYVNLEPCAHFGKNPPCCNLIIDYKIPRVVIGCIDTFPEVSGKGIERMKDNGIDIKLGVLESESRELNKRFFTYYEKKRPYIILKWANSKDGFIAPKEQSEHFWMTCTESKKIVHQWRAVEDAILVGRNTAEKDNPSLTVREIEGNHPIRIVIDKDLKLSNALDLFNSQAETIIFNSIKTKEINSNVFLKVNFNSLITNILKELYNRKIQSIIVEGGARTLQTFIDRNMWDEVRIFTANEILFDGVRAPKIEGKIISEKKIKDDVLKIFIND